MEKEIVVGSDPEKALKEIVQTIKDSGAAVVCVDPMTGTFMADGFMSKGMPTNDNARTMHAKAYEAFDLGFARVFIDPELNSCMIINGENIAIKFEHKLY